MILIPARRSHFLRLFAGCLLLATVSFPLHVAAAGTDTSSTSTQPGMAKQSSDTSQYVEELLTKADKGDAKAQFDMGNAYFVGVGIAKNYVESVKWFRRAADQGYAKAESSLGTMYYQGKGVAKDINEAIRWWRKAAEHHDPDAQVQLGFAYLLGDGVPKNNIYAYMWFNLAAAQNDKHAVKDRDTVAKYMSSDQIAEAQRIQQEWIQKHP